MLNSPVKQISFSLLLLTAITRSHLCIAQDDVLQRITIGISGGNSYPLSDFGNISATKLPMSRYTGKDTNHLCGYAMPGAYFDFYAAYRVNKLIGIMVAIDGDINNVNINVLNSQYISYYPYSSVSAGTLQPFNFNQYLIGPIFNVNVSKVFSFEARTLVGFTTIYYPSITYNGFKDTVIVSYPTANAIGYSIGGGIKYIVTPDSRLLFALHANFIYSFSTLIFDNYSITNYNVNTPNYTYNDSKIMSTALLRAALGISISF